MNFINCGLFAFPQVNKCGAQEMESLIYVVFQLFERKRTRKFSIYGLASEITNYSHGKMPHRSTVPGGPFWRHFSPLLLTWTRRCGRVLPPGFSNQVQLVGRKRVRNQKFSRRNSFRDTLWRLVLRGQFIPLFDNGYGGLN